MLQDHTVLLQIGSGLVVKHELHQTCKRVVSERVIQELESKGRLKVLNDA